MTAEEIKSHILNVNKTEFSNVDSIISVTKMIDFLASKFDAEKQAKVCAEKGASDPKYKYAGMSAEQILESWSAKASESMHYGRLLDAYAGITFKDTDEILEVWKLDNNFDYDERLKNNCIGFEQFVSDIKAKGFEYAGRELTVYLKTPEGNVVTGRLDCLFYNEALNSYLIVDWKTTDEIKISGFGNKKFYGPGFDIDDCDMSKYTAQLHVYKESLAKTYNLADTDRIRVCVCNLRKSEEPSTGRNYLLYKENYQYSSKRIYDFVDFAIKKREAIKKTEMLNS